MPPHGKSFFEFFIGHNKNCRPRTAVELPMTEPFHLIACGVLRLDMDEIINRLSLPCSTTYLEGGLHEDPAKLRRMLQEAIDRVDRDGYERIVLGYGLCGRGTVGIVARTTPLVIPRVHDCIALFLGADAAYRREFAKCPGTYYISAGWYEEKVQPKGAAKHVEDPRDKKIAQVEVEQLSERYGAENAKEIRTFLSSWQRNYRRAAFIDTGFGDDTKYSGYARAMADAFGWEYERLEGDRGLLKKALWGDTSDGDILIVNPGFVTDFDARERKLVAHPTTNPGQTTNLPVSDLPNIPSEPTGINRGIGIGIDAGGTYTDAVVFDFAGRTVLDKGKALTTKWDYAIGIGQALAELDERWFSKIELVSVSTTLATNAIVEGTGQKTGLMIMPHGTVDIGTFHDPTAVIPGKMSIGGEEIEAVDTNSVISAANEMRRTQGVRAFAVSGYGGSVNPAHEMEVKRILIDQTGCDVCCGHEFSGMLDFAIRANTAVLNAGIIPLLERFLKDVATVLEERAIGAPIMVVKGDGSLMHSAFAAEHPVETVLSGPAASIAGARYLTESSDATVVDVGGTTSDIGKIANRHVRICREGAQVGSYRTHVQAIDMRTVGLGGDSEVRIEKQELRVGPRRIAPVSWISSYWTPNRKGEEMQYLTERVDDFAGDTQRAEFLWATGRKPEFELNDLERSVLDVLEDGPMSRLRLVDETRCGHIQLLRTQRLESDYVVQRCGLTPTDVLHVTGDLELWDIATAEEYTRIIAPAANMSAGELAKAVMDSVTEKLMFELVQRQLESGSGVELEDSPAAKAIFDVLLAGGNHHLKVDLELSDPIIGLGAAAPLFLDRVAKHLHARLDVPDYADVANAVGAITSLVVVARGGSVSPAPDGNYHLSGVAGSASFTSFDEAYRELVVALKGDVIREAEAAGTEERTIALDVNDRMSTTADGAEVFLERQVTARITGVPVLTGNF